MIDFHGYKVCESGKIYNAKGRQLKPWVHYGRNGQYLRITLTIDGCKRGWRVHRVVAMCYLPNPKNKPEVHHIDGDTFNNCKENLQWVTRKENERYKRFAKST